MPTLFGFGDSFTQGVGLEKHIDCYNTEPSQYAWPQVTADILGIDVKNLGVGGHANKAIAYDVTRNLHQITSDDIVVIMWSTGFYRNYFLTDDPQTQYHFCPISATGSDPLLAKLSKFAIEYMSDKSNILFDQSMLIVATDAVLRQKTNRVLHVMVQCLDWEDCADHHEFIVWQNILEQDWVYHLFQPELALHDRSITPLYAEFDKHYSKEQHAFFSQKLSKVIAEKFLTK